MSEDQIAFEIDFSCIGAPIKISFDPDAKEHKLVISLPDDFYDDKMEVVISVVDYDDHREIEVDSCGDNFAYTFEEKTIDQQLMETSAVV